MKTLRKTAPIVALATLLMLSACSGGASPVAGGGGSTDATVTLKLAYVLNDSHPMIAHGVLPFIEEVEERSGGSIKFDVYSGGQLGDGTISVVRDGLTDMVLNSTPQTETTTSQVFLLPHGMDEMTSSQALWRALHEDGVIKDEWDNLGIMSLMTGSTSTYEVSTTSTPLPGVDSLEGLRLRVLAGPGEKLAVALDATPVQIDPAEAYDALQRGTVDGSFIVPASWAAFSLQEVFRHTTIGLPQGAAAGINLVIGKDSWNKLSDEQKQIMYEAGRSATLTAQQATIDEAARIIDDAIDNYDLTTYEWSEEDKAAFRTKAKPVLAEWAADADSKGFKGTEAVEQMLEFREAASQNPMEFPDYPISSMG